jgi:hypothetical protein
VIGDRTVNNAGNGACTVRGRCAHRAVEAQFRPPDGNLSDRCAPGCVLKLASFYYARSSREVVWPLAPVREPLTGEGGTPRFHLFPLVAPVRAGDRLNELRAVWFCGITTFSVNTW